MVTPLTVHARTPATLQLLAPQWPNLTHNSHFVHQTVTVGDGACHSSPSSLSSSSRSPSSAGDDGETSSAGHGSDGASASRSSSPPPLFLHTIMAIIDMKALFPTAGLLSVGHLFVLLKIKWQPLLDLHGGCLVGGLPKPKL